MSHRSVNVPIIKRTLCQDKLSENLYVKFCPVFASKTSIHVLGNQRYDSIFVDGHLGILALGKMCERGTQIMRYHHVSWWMDFAILVLLMPSCSGTHLLLLETCDNNQKAYKTCASTRHDFVRLSVVLFASCSSFPFISPMTIANFPAMTFEYEWGAIFSTRLLMKRKKKNIFRDFAAGQGLQIIISLVFVWFWAILKKEFHILKRHQLCNFWVSAVLNITRDWLRIVLLIFGSRHLLEQWSRHLSKKLDLRISELHLACVRHGDF